MTRLVSNEEKDLMRSDYEATLLDQLADIARNTETGEDPHGHPLPPVWESLYENWPCRFWTTKEQERRGPGTLAVIQDAEMEVAFGTDITEDDRVVQVRDLDGTVRGGPFEIVSIRVTDVNIRITLIRGKSA